MKKFVLRKQKCLLAICFMLFSSLNIFAQQRTVTGKIIDQATRSPLQDAVVTIKGTTQAAITNSSGAFTIPVTSREAVLVVSHVGYGTQELSVGSQSEVSIAMSNSVANLNEVVVIGYGQVKKRDLTGSVVSIKGDEVTKVPATTPIEAIQGKIPGADIFRANGYAGQGASIRIRGTRSIANPGSSNSVLYIIDGVQGVSMSDINPNDIQSIDVLKDASSTSIYGSRGANGVIIITTKRGTSGKPRLSFNTYSGVSEVAGYGEFMNGTDWVNFRREAFRAAGTWNSAADDPKAFNALQLEAIQKGQFVNWPSLLLQKGRQQDYQIGVSGGSDRTKIYFSAGYFHEKGLMKLDEFKRYTARLNVDQTINNWLKAGIQSQFAYIDNDIRRDPFNQATRMVPVGLPYDSAGNFVVFPLNGTNINPLADEQPNAYQRNTKTTRFTGAAYVELTPVKDLSLRSTFSTTMSGVVAGRFDGRNTIDQRGSNTLTSITNNQSTFLSWENLLTYTKEINNHAFTLTGVTSYIETVSTNSFTQATNQLFASQGFYNLGGATGNPTYGSGYSKNNLISFTGRVNYNYLGKYLLTLTGRSDGSSKLGTGNKWAFFPSAAVGWRISDEGFMKDRKLFSDLKLRASYGISGNDVIGAYATQDLLSSVQFSYNDASAVNTYIINPTIGNDELQWELTATKDLGVDFGILNNRITGSIDYYDAITSNLIFPYTLPSSTGVTTVNRNVGKTRNKGIEVGITTNNITRKDFTWSTNITFARNREKIVELPNGNVIADDYRNSLIQGQSPTIYYDYVKLGIWQLGEEAEATKFSAVPGDIKIADIAGGPDGKPDGKITSADRTIIGTRVPKWTGGLNNDFKYKGFDLNILFIARMGQWISSDYYAKYVRSGAENGAKISYWTPENPTNDYPRPHATRASTYVTTLTEREASFVKLRNITLGYTLPGAVSKRWKIDNVRLWVSGRNLYSFTDLKDFDPEGEGVIDRPLNRLYVGGLNITF